MNLHEIINAEADSITKEIKIREIVRAMIISTDPENLLDEVENL